VPEIGSPMKKLDLFGIVAGRLVVPSCSVVIVAAGKSERMGGVDKMLAEVGGSPMILVTAGAFERNPAVKEIIVVARKDIRKEIETILKNGNITKLAAVVDGGNTRAESVNKGVNWCSKKYKLIAVHDGARPLVSQEIINETLMLAGKTKAAAPALPVRDTIRICEGGVGIQTPDRAKLYAVQTPQIFDADLLRAALVNSILKKLDITDDCSAVEAIGMKCSMSQGEEENLKVTTPLDLAIVNSLARKRV